MSACLTALSGILLLVGYRLIRLRRIAEHRVAMLTACTVSLLFLVSYLIYHSQVGATRFTGQGWVRPIYFVLLISHTVLAAVIVPLVLTTLWRALTGRVAAHRRVARWTFPLWLYVSATGVVIYLMLYHIFPSH